MCVSVSKVRQSTGGVRLALEGVRCGLYAIAVVPLHLKPKLKAKLLSQM